MSEANGRVNRRKYQLAQEMVDKGAWVVDIEAGTIHSSKFGRQLSMKPRASGYHTVGVWDAPAKRPHTALVSRIIWEYAHGEIPDGLEVNHKSGNKSDNGIANLELLTSPENIRHAHDTGLWPSIIRSSLADDIAAALAAGRSYLQIETEFDVGAGTVHRINVRRPDYQPPRRIDPTATEKGCPRCGELKPLDDFNRCTTKPDGRQSACRQCAKPRHCGQRQPKREAA